MDDNNLMQILGAFKGALDFLLNKIDEMDKMYEDNRNQTDERIHALESTLYDEIINPTKAYIDETNKNARFDDFNSKYGEKLGGFNDSLKALEGDEDFDLTKAAFDKYDSLDESEKPEADEYVNALVEELSSQLENIKKGLGLSEDAEVTVTQDENGETVVEADGEVVATDNGEAPAEEAQVEESDTNNEDGSEEAEEDEEDNPEDIAAFEEELKNYK